MAFLLRFKNLIITHYLPFFLILVICSPLHTFSQNLKNFYYSSSNAKGTLYFIKPLTLHQTTKNKQIAKEIKIDFTYPTVKDSVSILFTFIADNPLKLEEIQLNQKKYPLYCIFKDYKKNKWVYRLNFILPFNEWKKLSLDTKPYQIEFLLPKPATYSFTTKKWKKLKSIHNLFFQIINTD